MHGKLFPNVSIDASPHLDQALGEALRGTVLTFSLLWTRGVAVALYALHVREQGGPWQNRIPTVVGDNDGEISVVLGTFDAGTVLEIFFGVLAVSAKVPKAATFVARDAAQVYKVSPPGPEEFKSIERTERWEDTRTYTVPPALTI